MLGRTEHEGKRRTVCFKTWSCIKSENLGLLSKVEHNTGSIALHLLVCLKAYCYLYFRSVTNDPTTKAVDNKTDLQLALNTAQLGRTFQDRSHVILLKSRSTLPLKFQHSNIYYIGGMGKRGNIVQTYPAMEYRFTPERITVTTDDVVCFAWSGETKTFTSLSLF